MTKGCLILVVSVLTALESMISAPTVVRGGTQAYPNDPYFPQQWALHNTGQEGGGRGADIHALQGWRITHCSPHIVIAIVDSGIDSQYADVRGKLVPGTSLVPEASSSQDDNGHGTAVGAVAAADTNNRKGIAGVCPLGRLMPVKAIAANGHAYIRDTAQGIRWAVDHGARVINLSLGSFVDGPRLRTVTTYAYDHGVVVVAGAGNNGAGVAFYPAADPHVLAVGGSDNQDRRWYRSNYGERDLVLAPSVSIMTVHGVGRSRHYEERTGTSYGAALVSGLAALILSVRPGLSVDQVIAAIEGGADPVQGQSGFNRKDGWGHIDCYRSLKIAMAMPVAAPRPVPSPTPALAQTL